MQTITILFFGSTADSVSVAQKLLELRSENYELRISSIITQPPKPVGRNQTITATPVEIWAKQHAIPVLSFPSDPQTPWLYEHEETVADTLAPFKADLLVSASYGQKIPDRTIGEAKFGGVNVHPSILPRWRGADPVPWALLTGDHQTGVTIVTVTKEFDGGKIIAQQKIPIGSNDFSDPLRSKLFTTGADLLCSSLPDFLSGQIKGTVQDPKKVSIARRFTRDDGFIPWKLIQKIMNYELGITNEELCGKKAFEEYSNITSIHNYLKHRETSVQDESCHVVIERFFRALSPWPGLWTLLRQGFEGQAITEKRLKILACHISHNLLLSIDTVQLEGKRPVSWKQFSSAYLPLAT